MRAQLFVFEFFYIWIYFFEFYFLINDNYDHGQIVVKELKQEGVAYVISDPTLNYIVFSVLIKKDWANLS